ncbi:MAG: hypothetical protein ACK41E_10160 [Deinococcales bacterium]
MLPNAEHLMLSGLATHLTPAMIHEAVEHLRDQLPPADVILALHSDSAALVFELSLSLKIPFVSASVLDVVASDDLETTDFLADPNLLQVHSGQDTFGIARSAISPQSRVLLFRDVLVRDTDILPLLQLVTAANAKPVGVATLIEAAHLDARATLAKQGIAVFSVIVLKRK